MHQSMCSLISNVKVTNVESFIGRQPTTYWELDVKVEILKIDMYNFHTALL